MEHSLKELEELGATLLTTGSTSKEFDGKTYTTLYELGYAYFEARNLLKAKEVFQAMLNAYPLSLDVIQALGTTNYLLKDYEPALRAFRVYQFLSPKSHVGFLYESYLWIDQGKKEEATEKMQAALSLMDKNTELYTQTELMLKRLKEVIA